MASNLLLCRSTKLHSISVESGRKRSYRIQVVATSLVQYANGGTAVVVTCSMAGMP